MPIEQSKEAAKIVVETSGAFSSIWHYIISALGVGIVGLWGHITTRIAALEKDHITAKRLDKHEEDEREKFKLLFSKHDEVIGKVSQIAASVARIEGKLDK